MGEIPGYLIYYTSGNSVFQEYSNFSNVLFYTLNQCRSKLHQYVFGHLAEKTIENIESDEVTVLLTFFDS